LLEGDAPEISHDEVIWNCSTELIDRVDKYVGTIRADPALVKAVPPEEITRTVDAIRLLRPICREIAIRLEWHRLGKKLTKSNSKLIKNLGDSASQFWPRMVQDIDHTLHAFRYRDTKDPPRFRARGGRILVPSDDESSDDGAESIAVGTETANTKANVNIVAALEEGVNRLLHLQPFQEDLVIPDSIKLEAGNDILVRFNDRQASGCIRKVEDQMKAVYVSYEDLPSCFDEFQPMERIQQRKEVPGSGEPSSSIGSEDVGDASRTKQIVFCPLGGEGEVSQCWVMRHSTPRTLCLNTFISINNPKQVRRAVVLSTKSATFYLVRLQVGNHSLDRWLYRDSIISMVERMEPSSVTVAHPLGLDLPTPMNSHATTVKPRDF
jgi:hypothetical protein